MIQRRCARATANPPAMAGSSSGCLIGTALPVSPRPAMGRSTHRGRRGSRPLHLPFGAVAKAVHAPTQLEWDTPLYQQASTQLEHALALADVPDFVSTRLRHPE